MEYNHKNIEAKWQKEWDCQKPYKVTGTAQKKAYILDMFPYPSGAGLHIGHPLGYTGSDIYSRYLRAKGYQVLHPMGYDAFGLPAEQHAINTGEHPGKITRINCSRFTKQLKELGFAYDWDRELATCDPEYYHWTQWIFLQIYNSWFDEVQGKARPISELSIPDHIKQAGQLAIQAYQAEHRLAYYADAMVNWCPALGTVLANEEVIDGKSERGNHDVIRKPMRQWLLRITKYSERLLKDLELLNWPESIIEQQRNWIGKRNGAEIDFAVADKDLSFRAFTTRPDTLFGVTFFVVSPEHPLVEQVVLPEFIEQVRAYREQAAKLSDLDRTIENRDKTGQFTGAFVINPINSERVPLYVGDYVLMSYGTGAVMGVPAHDERDFIFAQKFKLDIRPVIAPKDEELRTKIAKAELCWTEPGVMLPCNASVAIELKLTDQSNEQAKELIVTWLEKNNKGNKVVNYRLRDWLFSRQRYWGEPIPIVHWEDGTVTALSETELPLLLPEVADYKPADGGESPLAKAGDWVTVICPKTGKKGRRETNTMPQWAGSCWYYLRFIDPHNNQRFCDPELEKAWMPVDFYIGGAEHAVLHLLYARFWHKILFDLGHVSTPEPFQRLFNQGHLVSYAYKDARGALVPVDQVSEISTGSYVLTNTKEPVEKILAKMSKSLKNVVNPDDIIAQYGADTLRVYLMFMGPLEAMKPWDSLAITGSNRFIKKVWTLVTTRLNHLNNQNEETQEVIKARHLAVKRVTESIECIRYNTAISALMEFVNEISNKTISKSTLEDLLILLAPFAPHVAEELWSLLGHQTTINKANWPEFDPEQLKSDIVNTVIQVNGKKRAVFDQPVDIDDATLQSNIIALMATSSYPLTANDKFIVVRDKQNGAPKLVNVISKST